MQQMAGKLDSPLQSPLALSLPTEILGAQFNRQHRPEVNTTWTLCRECPRERTWVVFVPEDWGHHLWLARRILLISS